VRRLGRIVAGAFGWLLAVCGGIIFLGSAATLRRSSATFGTDLFVVFFYLAVTGAGVVLVRVAWPGVFGRIGREMLATLTSMARFSSPLVHGLAVYVAAVPLLAITGEGAILVAAAFALLYAVASPVLIAMRPRLWLNVPLSIVVGIVLIAAIPGTAEALAHKRFGDDWMVMLGPVMLYPVVLGAALLFRIVSRRRRPLPSPAAPSE